MANKDQVIRAYDALTEVMKALCRINFDNDRQTQHNCEEALASTMIVKDALETIIETCARRGE